MVSRISVRIMSDCDTTDQAKAATLAKVQWRNGIDDFVVV